MFKAIKLLMSHGMSGYLILIAAVFCIVIAIDRLYYLYVKISLDAKAALILVQKEILSRNYNNALQICNNHKQVPELTVVREGLLAVENGREAMNSAISAAVLDVSRGCETRLSFLSLIASSATLLGLFGTIMGLISTFEAIANADPASKGRLLGNGISEAMYSTAGGVIVGVAAMIVHTICVSKSDVIVGKAQNAALSIVKWIEQSERSNG